MPWDPFQSAIMSVTSVAPLLSLVYKDGNELLLKNLYRESLVQKVFSQKKAEVPFQA